MIQSKCLVSLLLLATQCSGCSDIDKKKLQDYEEGKVVDDGMLRNFKHWYTEGGKIIKKDIETCGWGKKVTYTIQLIFNLPNEEVTREDTGNTSGNTIQKDVFTPPTGQPTRRGRRKQTKHIVSHTRTPSPPRRSSPGYTGVDPSVGHRLPKASPVRTPIPSPGTTPRFGRRTTSPAQQNEEHYISRSLTPTPAEIERMTTGKYFDGDSPESRSDTPEPRFDTKVQAQKDTDGDIGMDDTIKELILMNANRIQTSTHAQCLICKGCIECSTNQQKSQIWERAGWYKDNAFTRNEGVNVKAIADYIKNEPSAKCVECNTKPCHNPDYFLVGRK